MRRERISSRRRLICVRAEGARVVGRRSEMRALAEAEDRNGCTEVVSLDNHWKGVMLKQSELKTISRPLT